MQIGYLEIVTNDVVGVCATYAATYGCVFGEPEPFLGGARTTALAGGGKLGVRPPMRADEAPVVRPYFLVEDAAAAVEAAGKSGAEIAVPPMPLPGQGTCAIFLGGGNDHGIWQNE